MDDVERFNRQAYDRNAALTLPKARFRMTLARYLVMDAFVHPTQHILYHALKTGRDETFLLTLEKARSLLAWYDPAMDILGSFEDFFEGEGARWRFFGGVDSHAFPRRFKTRSAS